MNYTYKQVSGKVRHRVPRSGTRTYMEKLLNHTNRGMFLLLEQEVFEYLEYIKVETSTRRITIYKT